MACDSLCFGNRDCFWLPYIESFSFLGYWISKPSQIWATSYANLPLFGQWNFFYNCPIRKVNIRLIIYDLKHINFSFEFFMNIQIHLRYHYIIYQHFYLTAGVFEYFCPSEVVQPSRKVSNILVLQSTNFSLMTRTILSLLSFKDNSNYVISR